MARAAVAAAALAGPAAGQTVVKVEAGIPAYARTSGVSGNVSSVGSDTMNNLMTLWGETFAKMYPNVRIQVEGKGSSTAPPALIAGSAQFGPMSRVMRPTEIDQFEKKYGYKPTQLRAAYDALAVYVNKDNPLEKATVAEIDGVFSKTRRRGGKNAANWGALGLTGDWSARPISLYGRNSASGTYGFFKEKVLGNGDYKDTVKEQPGSASVVQGVTEDRFGIGYSGIGYRTSGVKTVALSEKAGVYSNGSYEDVVSGKYPLARFLYIYVNKAPGKPLDPSVLEFLKLIYSQQGQEIVVKDGYYPLPASIVAEELKKIQ
ncbi:MAG TPA: PstS family phosphate ABC transporter substrate-binding protein [Vicinamibacteria bacterium]|nr:PstS family phosphate ABC transporter substrate-binding protein [Vicinamibacteria bacterium]